MLFHFSQKSYGKCISTEKSLNHPKWAKFYVACKWLITKRPWKLTSRHKLNVIWENYYYRHLNEKNGKCIGRAAAFFDKLLAKIKSSIEFQSHFFCMELYRNYWKLFDIIWVLNKSSECFWMFSENYVYEMSFYVCLKYFCRVLSNFIEFMRVYIFYRNWNEIISIISICMRIYWEKHIYLWLFRGFMSITHMGPKALSKSMSFVCYVIF